MQKTSPPFTVSLQAAVLPPARLLPLIDSFLLAGDINEHSARTLGNRRERLSWFAWWVERDGTESIGKEEVRRFLQYLRHGHKEPGGRFGLVRLNKEPSPGTVKAYHSSLRTFFNWCVLEGEIPASPMASIPPPIDRPDQVQPFTDDEVRRLHAAAKRHRRNHGERRITLMQRRDEAILTVLLDTGARASEICSLTVGDVDLSQMTLRVRQGKGGKARTVSYQRDTRRALYDYLKLRSADEDEALFPALRGPGAGECLTRRGLALIVGRWGEAAGITRERCSPHTFRHTMAINFLRGGGDVFRLKMLLGHGSLTMTSRYVALAQTDISQRDAKSSPVARILGRKKGSP